MELVKWRGWLFERNKERLCVRSGERCQDLLQTAAGCTNRAPGGVWGGDWPASRRWAVRSGDETGRERERERAMLTRTFRFTVARKEGLQRAFCFAHDRRRTGPIGYAIVHAPSGTANRTRLPFVFFRATIRSDHFSLSDLTRSSAFPVDDDVNVAVVVTWNAGFRTQICPLNSTPWGACFRQSAERVLDPIGEEERERKREANRLLLGERRRTRDSRRRRWWRRQGPWDKYGSRYPARLQCRSNDGLPPIPSLFP